MNNLIYKIGKTRNAVDLNVRRFLNSFISLRFTISIVALLVIVILGFILSSRGSSYNQIINQLNFFLYSRTGVEILLPVFILYLLGYVVVSLACIIIWAKKIVNPELPKTLNTQLTARYIYRQTDFSGIKVFPDFFLILFASFMVLRAYQYGTLHLDFFLFLIFCILIPVTLDFLPRQRKRRYVSAIHTSDEMSRVAFVDDNLKTWQEIILREYRSKEQVKDHKSNLVLYNDFEDFQINLDAYEAAGFLDFQKKDGYLPFGFITEIPPDAHWPKFNKAQPN